MNMNPLDALEAFLDVAVQNGGFKRSKDAAVAYTNLELARQKLAQLEEKVKELTPDPKPKTPPRGRKKS